MNNDRVVRRKERWHVANIGGAGNAAPARKATRKHEAPTAAPGRLPSTLDRRSYVLHLTSEGRKALVRMRAIVYENEKRLAEKFRPGDAQDLRRMLSAFRDD
jgi:hypothetical protein